MAGDDEGAPNPPSSSTPKSQSSAAARVDQVSQHLTPDQKDTPPSSDPPATRRRRAKKDDALPADYSDILGQLRQLRTIANTPDLSRTGYVRQKQAGKLWVRERIDKLLDQHSFREIGSATGHVTWRPLPSDPTREEIAAFLPHNNIQGFGRLGGRQIVFTADDFSIRAGHQDGNLMAKTLYTEKLALQLKLPMIKLTDGSSGGGSVTSIAKDGYSYVPPIVGFDVVTQQLNAGIPNLGAVLGPAIGLGAARVVACHFSVMAASVGALFNAGPQVVKDATFEEGLSFTDLGGPHVHCTNGTIDNLAPDEDACFAQLRAILAYLPNAGTHLPPPPSTPSADPPSRATPSLRTAIPRNRARTYDIRKIITTLVDAGTFFEIGALWGRTTITGLARVHDHAVGIIANNPELASGALDAPGAQKLTRHLKFCDTFNLPILQLVDAPGYAVGTLAERTATMRHGIDLARIYYATSTPIFSIILRKAYGVAGGIMLDSRDPHTRVAWPSGEWGSLPLAGGIEVAHAAELRRLAAADPAAHAARYAHLRDTYTRLMNPVRSANHFSIEEIVDPADSRRLVCAWADLMYAHTLPERVALRLAGRLHPVFT